jgi:hypothetical protein
MASFYPLGRLGTELCQLPFYALDMLVKHSPDGDPWLRGETLEVVIKRMALLSGREYADVKKEVTVALKEKHEKAESLKNADSQAMLWRECEGFGGIVACDVLEKMYD